MTKACAGERELRCVCCRGMFFSTKENREEHLISGCRIKMWFEKIHATFTDNVTKNNPFRPPNVA